ncbi:MAG: type IV pilus secretin PilQ [Acidobacteria bacterium]|nr:type IV pilus secretin PilQ [Acidobacteriota bacterium]
MKFKKAVLLTVWSILGLATAGRAANELLGVRTVVEPQATTLLLRLPAPVPYTPAKVGSDLFVVDLANVSTERSSDSQPVQSPLISSYRFLSYQGADNRPHLALEITLQDADAQAAIREVPEGLEIRIAKADPQPDSPKTAKASAPTPFAAAASPSAAISLREVAVLQPESGPGLDVEIIGNGMKEYRTFELRNPNRLVVDIPNAVNRIRQNVLEINTPPLKAIRIAQFSQRPLVSRIVMDLDSKVPFQVVPQSDRLLVSLGGSAKAEAKPADLPGAALEQTAQTIPVAAPKEQEAVLVASNHPLEGLASGILPSPLAAVREQGASPVTSPALLAKVPEPANLPKAIPAPAEPKIGSEASLSLEPPNSAVIPPAPLQPKLIAAAMPPPIPQVAAATPQTQYTGEPISVNLKDVDLDDFFRLIHEISGLNIVVDPAVSGTVTIVLDEVPWDQALDIVLRNNGLEARTVGNVVRIAKVSTLEAEARAELAKAQAEAQREAQGQPTEMVTRTLSYAKAPELVPTLKRFLSARGELVPDARTNMLIITDIPANIAQIDRLIGTLDQKSQQVEIEARIVAASRSFARDIGVQLAASGRSGNVVLGGAGLVGQSPIVRGTVPPLFIGTPPKIDPDDLIPRFANVSQPLNTSFTAVNPLNSGMSLVLTSGANFALDAIITAGEARGLGKLLSRPKVITQNNVEATVKQGVRIPIQTNVNNTISVQFVDVVLRMTVTPQITAEGTIFLTTDVENTTIDPGIARIQGIPALDTQQATTQVLVSNGGTVFFGGVIQTINNVTEEQTPLLGSIPIIGNLFKRKATSSSTNELLFFITPKLVQS